jgi:hypothetical protein
MTSKTTTKTSSPRTSRKNSQQLRKKHSVNRINRQRRLQKQLHALILERHSRRCIICHHPEREDIEEEFVHWRSPSRLAHDYKLGDYRTIYRHARAAGLLLQRRERLHSALDAFVESVDDVTFTGDTILRAMRAYSCIDSHGRWTEIPTQVQFSTSHGAHPPQPPTRTSNVDSDVIDIGPDPETEDDAEEDADNAPEERVTALDVLNVIRKYANQASQGDATASSVPPKIKSCSNGTTCSVSPKMKLRSDATSCAAPPAEAVSVTSDDNDELDDDPDSDEPDDDAGEESEEAAENELEEALASLSTSSKSLSRSDTTACAASPAQPVSAVPLTSNHHGRTETATACAVSPAQALNVLHSHDGTDDDPDDNDDNNDPKNKSDADRLEETTACAAPLAQSVLPLSSNRRGRNVTATASAASASSKTRSRSDATACAVSPAQALPRDVVRGQNPNDRSPSDRTDCAALPAQPPVPQKPTPDADGLIWHPHPGYPNQEMSEPDAQGRVRYKIHMTTAASQLPSSGLLCRTDRKSPRFCRARHCKS